MLSSCASLSVCACDDDYLCAFDANVYYFSLLSLFSEVSRVFHMHTHYNFQPQLDVFPFYLICRLISDEEKKKKGKRPESQGQQQHTHSYTLDQKQE